MASSSAMADACLLATAFRTLCGREGLPRSTYRRERDGGRGYMWRKRDKEGLEGGGRERWRDKWR